jgi:hypothetical protein
MSANKYYYPGNYSCHPEPFALSFAQHDIIAVFTCLIAGPNAGFANAAVTVT